VTHYTQALETRIAEAGADHSLEQLCELFQESREKI
jgi:hypothetical protein